MTGGLTTPSACSTGHPTRPITAPKLTPTISISISGIGNGNVAASRFGSGVAPARVEAGFALGANAGFSSGHALIRRNCVLVGRVPGSRRARSDNTTPKGRGGDTEKSPQSIYPKVGKTVCGFAEEH